MTSTFHTLSPAATNSESDYHSMSRREAIMRGTALAAIGAGGLTAPLAHAQPEPHTARNHAKEWRLPISLAQWSLHRALDAKELEPLDFPMQARHDYDIGAVEYVNRFYKDSAGDDAYFKELRKRADAHNVKSLLIMCDHKEALGDPDKAAREKAVEVHKPWLDAAAILGCHSIRVNLAGTGTPEEHAAQAAESLRKLCELADPLGLNVIVENHGGNSSIGSWLMGVMRSVNHPRVGTLPDFGNFYEYDRYMGVREMLPFARGVSAKSYDFDDTGEETKINYWRMMKLVRASGYDGHVGIEYEGERMPEPDGVRATKRLLEEIMASLGGV
jgi:sugar phosphate isomerase/epimerase